MHVPRVCRQCKWIRFQCVLFFACAYIGHCSIEEEGVVVVQHWLFECYVLVSRHRRGFMEGFGSWDSVEQEPSP